MYVIYALIDPRDNTAHYVGVTTDVYKRFYEHIHGNGSNIAKTAWIIELRALNRMVIMETLEEVDTREESLDREAYWIRHFEMLRDPIANIRSTFSPRRSRRKNMRSGRKISLDVSRIKVGNIALPEEIDRTPEVENAGTHFIIPEQQPRAKHVFTEEEVNAAVAAWEAGARSDRLLQQALNVTRYRANQLNRLLAANNLVKRKPK